MDSVSSSNSSSSSSKANNSYNSSSSEHSQDPDGTSKKSAPNLQDRSTTPSKPLFDTATLYGSLTPNSQNEIAWQGLRKMQAHVTQKRLNYEVNPLSKDTLESLEVYVDKLTEMLNAVDDKKSPFRKHTKEFTAFEVAHKALTTALEEAMTKYKDSGKTQMWNLASGLMAFVLCFSPGTLASSALARPWLALLISPFFWILTERLLPMIRATSWTNKHADTTYPLIMRVVERAARDWVRSLAGCGKKRYPGKTKGTEMTAAEYLRTLDIFAAWLGKVGTDDMPYFFYTFFYALRNVLLIMLATSDFLRTDVGVAVSLCTLLAAGCCAGASTSATFQALRERAYRLAFPNNPDAGQSLVKSRAIWKKDKKFIAAQKTLLKKHQETENDQDEKETLGRVIELLEKDRLNAEAKSGFWSSIGFEMGCLFQEKRLIGSNDAGEVAGRRVETVASFLGKATCLIPSVVFNQTVTLPYNTEGQTSLERILVTTLAASVLIFAFGFRKEAEMLWRAVIGILRGLADLIRIYFLGAQDKYKTADRGADGSVLTSVTTIKDNNCTSEQDIGTLPDDSSLASSNPLASKKSRVALAQATNKYTVDGESFHTTSPKYKSPGKFSISNKSGLQQPEFDNSTTQNSSKTSADSSEKS